jgi:hypothetical protein
MGMNDDDLDFGSCCACEGLDGVRNIIMLDVKALTPGKGWGCVVCHLPNDGAVAVLCDRCLETNAEVRFAVDGWTTDKKRVKIEELTIEHKHDMKYHHEVDDMPYETVDRFDDYEED